MKRFHHTRDNKIIVSNGENEFALPLDEFLLNVPDYPGLPDGFVERYLTDDKHYLTAINFEQIHQEPLPEAQEWIDICIQVELSKRESLLQEQEQKAAEANQYRLQTSFDTGLGYRLGTEDRDQEKFARFKIGLLSLDPQPPDDFVIRDIIKDVNGVKKEITYGQFKAAMNRYTLHCMQLEANK
jgi:hypothetical protein